ncbi:unnamed protein product, partial [Sphacelaria rigidula]
AAAARNSEGTVGMDAVFAGMHRERLRKAAYNREYQAAVTAFSKMDQNSGRVSTPAFEDLLELLCIPEARRRGDATESARAAGLLSSYSFSCVEFTVWYLEWFFRPEADGSTKPAANGAPSAKSETRSRGSRPPSPSIPCISRWRRAQEAGSSSSSSEGSSSPTPNLTSSHSAKVDMFSGLGSVPRVQVKEGLEAAMAAASASPEPTDSEESNYLRFGLSGGQEELNRLRGLHLDGGHKAEASKAKAAVPSTASKRRESAEAVVAAAASLRATVTAQTAGHSTDGSSSNSESSEFSVGRRGMRSIPQRRRGEDTASPGERSEGSGNTVLSGLASEDSAAERRRSEEDEARIRVDLANAYVPFKSQAPATQAPRAAGVVPRPGGSPLLSPAGTQRPGQFSF